MELIFHDECSCIEFHRGRYRADFVVVKGIFCWLVLQYHSLSKLLSWARHSLIDSTTSTLSRAKSTVRDILCCVGVSISVLAKYSPKSTRSHSIYSPARCQRRWERKWSHSPGYFRDCNYILLRQRQVGSILIMLAVNLFGLHRVLWPPLPRQRRTRLG